MLRQNCQHYIETDNTGSYQCHKMKNILTSTYKKKYKDTNKIGKQHVEGKQETN